MQPFNDKIWDKKLNIKTCGSDYSDLDAHNFGYDPTPYYCLTRLAESGHVTGEDVFVDFGCGMGRACFAINYLTGAKAIGIDFNSRFLNIARSNLEGYRNKDIDFVLSDATEYEITKGSVFYFYNPFSCDIQLKVLDNIKAYRASINTKIKLVFLQPIRHVEDALKEEDLTLIDKIDLRPLIRSKTNHMFMYVYEM
ncbi:MAG: class I SAM-dependent methyltransferase [Saccharofermentans sp.]|nr:class I SAM-dependent methyltransferase [Saccharofermentans sp.]